MANVNNILVADCGSTKTDWILSGLECGILEVRTMGINPVRDSRDAIFRVLSEELMPQLPSDCGVEDIFFYGAGCMEPYSLSIKEALLELFPDARVSVESDLLGAARALCGHQEGVACILGTGANSCFYDGNKIVSHVSPLGFILGDEGSGAVLGKIFVANLLKGIFPESMKQEFFQEYKLSEVDVIDRVYRQPQPNRFLASIVPFIGKHRGVPFVHDMLVDSFRSFFSRNVRAYHRAEMPVNFVGSIAYIYNDELQEAAKAEDLLLGKVLRSPIYEILSFHINQNK